MAKKTRTADIAMPYKEKPSASITLGKEMKLPKLRVGGRVTVQVHGRITNVTDDEYSRSFRMTVDEIDSENGMGGDLDEMKEKRKY